LRLVLDWDGTCTQVDSLHLVLEAFGDRDVYERVERELLAGRMSYRELMEAEFATVSAPLEQVNGFLEEEVRLRPGFDELAARHSPLILSSGFHELIEPLLDRRRLDLELRANRIEPRPEGWRVLWRDEAACAVCGDLCKRGSLPKDRPLVYVGDGYSDRCAALVCDRVFARDGLAAYLDELGMLYEPFETLNDVAAALS
jgi:2-hydroxy-3-keto-5-methylthiopentenyl-1-phosphate phosphatase